MGGKEMESNQVNPVALWSQKLEKNWSATAEPVQPNMASSIGHFCHFHSICQRPDCGLCGAILPLDGDDWSGNPGTGPTWGDLSQISNYLQNPIKAKTFEECPLLHASRYNASNNKRAESFISQIDEQIEKKIVQNSAPIFH